MESEHSRSPLEKEGPAAGLRWRVSCARQSRRNGAGWVRSHRKLHPHARRARRDGEVVTRKAGRGVRDLLRQGGGTWQSPEICSRARTRSRSRWRLQTYARGRGVTLAPLRVRAIISRISALAAGLLAHTACSGCRTAWGFADLGDSRCLTGRGSCRAAAALCLSAARTEHDTAE